jgi:hypothetical protein
MRGAGAADAPAPTLRRSLAAAFAPLWLAACMGWLERPAPPPPLEAPPEVVAVPPPAPLPPCERIAALEVRKSERVLLAVCVGGRVLSYPIALSREPGHKRARGDRRTPEGVYRVAAPARPSRFHRFLPIDYPSLADALAAYADGRISAEERDAIAHAHLEGRLPPQDTGLGGHLGFHGEGSRWRGDLDLDWTEGCFALTDDAIEAVSARAPPGTPVEILP